MTVTPGTRLGAYEIEARLGAGGMGEVYRARDTRLARDVAIKMLPEAFAADPERLTRFRREALTLASLNHPNVGSIYGLEESDGAPFLVLELMTGETLAARLAKGPLSVRETLALGVQVASAIEAAHEQGIVHRDLKPGNVMITATGTAKVFDFGLAKSGVGSPEVHGSQLATMSGVFDGTIQGLIIGTAAYMSPEQARGKVVDRRSDVWSFGCVLFECLTGRPAFAGETASDLIAQILERDPDWTALPAGMPARLRDVVRRCLRKDADQRPRDIRDARLELAELARGGADAGSKHEKSIAVLPFENLSGADDEYFADGVTDEILNALAHVEGLRVAARTSCFAFKGKREDLRTVGEKLDAATVLEGSVRRAGSRLRITAQLVNAADGYQLWSERYDREMVDVFEVQEEIAKAIVSRLRGALNEESAQVVARRGTKNLEAYELFLRGRALQNKRGRFLAEAIECFERAIALDPRYAEAMAWMSDSYRLMGTFGVAPFNKVGQKAREIAERALAIDPNLAEAWSTLACVAEQFDRDFEKGTRLYERVFELDPRHSRARAQSALWRVIRGTYSDEQAIAEFERAIQDDPLNAWVGAMYAHGLGYMGRHDESIALAERMAEIDREAFFSRWNVLRGHAWAGHHARAIELAGPLMRESGRDQWVLGTLGWTYGKAGMREQARAVHDELEGRSRHEFMGPFWLAATAASSGLEEASLGFVARCLAENDPLLVWGKSSPFWDTVRGYSRFEAITRGIWS